MDSSGPKEVGADQVLGPEILVRFIFIHLVLIDIVFNNAASVTLMGKKVLRFGKFCSKLRPMGPKLAQLTVQF